jgi:hypothetical protein
MYPRKRRLDVTTARKSWRNMMDRCYRPQDAYYDRYGGRGIVVCDQWRGADGRQRFVADVGEPPTPQHTLERMDNDGNYEPGNV